MLASRKITRQVKNLNAGNGLPGKPARTQGAITSALNSVWDTFMAFAMTILFVSLRITLFIAFWALLIMAVPVVIRHL